jgi:hypothetical protein
LSCRKYQANCRPDSTLPIAVLTYAESGLLIFALCLATLSPLLPSPKSLGRNRVTHWDTDSEAAFRGIPLERKLGTTTIIESTANSDRKDGLSRMGSMVKSPLKAKTKNGFTSSDTLVHLNENGTFTSFDTGIVKTTNFMTFSDEDLSSKVSKFFYTAEFTN